MAMALFFLAQTVMGSLYKIHNIQMSDAASNPFNFALQRAEKMFATDQGPFLSSSGESRIDMEIEGLHLTPRMDGWKVVVYHFHADDLSFLLKMEENIYMFACTPEKQIFATDGSNHFTHEEFEVFNHSLIATTSYKVLLSGWVDTVVAVCTKEGSRAEDALDFTGTLTVLNPYGLLPAVFYGLLPFRSVGMRTIARALLLVVCLGYGIVRNFLPPIQKWLIVFLSLAYFGTDGSLDHPQTAHRTRPSVWSFLQLLCNLSFVLWIYVALETILKELQVQKQWAKFAMYKSLAWALASFVVFFSLLTLVSVCGRFGVFEWKIEWEWMQLVAWPLLNFIVSLAMCWIWRPTARSSQFAFSTQLPVTEAGDDSDDDDETDMELASESRVPTFTIDDMDSDDAEEPEEGETTTPDQPAKNDDKPEPTIQ
ncbi:hypothetical protein DYB35_006670 [Aphanomyces astaci]|uniref:GOST seven transmembrane domain-containing protein n=1 Tax=Aphanomyces astaci TaxID=112090 RepID=A0A418DE41_APHAT|nr:hypothetical protein DYB35_006670 [Aphanomyces astaci]